jgi:hypothetical protein
MLAMQQSYAGLREKGSDLDYCKGMTIKDCFAQVGLASSWEFDERIEKYSKECEHESEQQES